MADWAIRVDNLSKEYSIAILEHATLRDQLAASVGRILRRTSIPQAETFWALRDASFEIRRGEVVGVIGRNGAGKSTLLKILSRITEPTRGSAQVRGRVGSLLEVGTGFHPDLTGRENVYLNGAILGMTRVEIARKFDEIVGFADLERFIDTPVKRYSSGMYMRLAFAVAAHLEPEILLIDEVLAVGDMQFQRKCLSKMEDTGRQGRTVLFVSHNMQAVARLCERTILLEGGRVVEDGPSHRAVTAYLRSGPGTTAACEWPDPARAPGSDVVRLRAVRVRNAAGEISAAVDIRKPVDVEMEFEVLQPGYAMMPSFNFLNDKAIEVFSSHDLDPSWRRRPRPSGRYVSSVRIPGNFLAEGMMLVSARLETLDPQVYQFEAHNAVAFQVIDSLDGDSARGEYAGDMEGVVRPKFKWHTTFASNGDQESVGAFESSRYDR